MKLFSFKIVDIAIDFHCINLEKHFYSTKNENHSKIAPNQFHRNSRLKLSNSVVRRSLTYICHQLLCIRRGLVEVINLFKQSVFFWWLKHVDHDCSRMDLLKSIVCAILFASLFSSCEYFVIYSGIRQSICIHMRFWFPISLLFLAWFCI